MQKIIIIVSVLAMLLLREECHGQSGSNRYTAGINYTVGVPTFVPQGNVSKVAIDTGTMKWYEYAQAGGWRWSGDRVQTISGCSAPSYTPIKGQSRFVINSCTEAQNGQGPELYYYNGSTWDFINEKGVSYTAGTGIGISGGVISNTSPDQVVSIAGGGINAVTGSYPNFTVTGTEVDGSTTNELQTISTGTNTLTLSNSGGTVTVDTDPTNDITSLSGGTGISVSGSGNSRTVTNTGDLSATNELQTISISGSDITLSNGGGTVSVPGGGVTWPLRGPDGSADGPTYSFENDTLAGMFLSGREGTVILGRNISLLVPIEDGGGVLVQAGAGMVNGGGGVIMEAGDAVTENGGGFSLSSGTSEYGTGGEFSLSAGGSINNQGGAFVISAGSGATGGGFTMSAGSGTSGGGGAFETTAGSDSGGGDGGYYFMAAGDAYGGGAGGGFQLNAGSGDYAGNVMFRGGDSFTSTRGGNIVLQPGANVDGKSGRVIMDASSEGFLYTPVTQSVRDNFQTVSVGQTIFCSNCTANDGSTGVMQTFNGSTWKNHW